MHRTGSLTTGDVATITGLSQRCVQQLCDRRTLKSHRIPGSTHRRVLPGDLEQFLRKYDFEHCLPLLEKFVEAIQPRPHQPKGDPAA